MHPDTRTREDLLAGLQPPPPPATLRAPTLAAAAAALDAPSPAPSDRWERIWSGTGWRLAWAACTIVLLAGHLLLSLPAPRPDVTADAAHRQELAEIAHLEPLRLDAEPSSALYGALARRPADPDRTKEPLS